MDFYQAVLIHKLKHLLIMGIKTLKDMKKEIFDYDDDEILNVVNEVGEEDRTNNDLTKDYRDKIEK